MPDRKGRTTADVFVVFGITGDLARVMTFRSLYRLERRGLLNCPIVGVAVDDWTIERLREHARDVYRRHRRADRLRRVRAVRRAAVLCQRRLHRRRHLRARRARRVGDAQHARVLPGDPAVRCSRPVIGRPRRRGPDQDRARRRGEAVRPRPRLGARAGRRNCTSTSTSPSSTGSITSSARWAPRSSSTCASPTRCSSRSGTATTSPACRSRWPSRFGVEDRGHFYDPVGALRDVVVNHLMQVLAVAAMEAPAGDDADDAQGRQVRGLPLDRRRRSGALRARSVRRLPRHRRRRAGLRRPRPTPRCVWRSTTGAGRACPSSSAPASICRSPRPSCASSFATRRAWGSCEHGHRRPEPDQLVVKLDPSTGTRVILDAHRADAGGPQAITLDMEFADEGGEGPTPYEVLLARRDERRLARASPARTPSKRPGASSQPLLDSPPPVHPYAQGSWGPEEADRLVAGYGGWHGPWIAT